MIVAVILIIAVAWLDRNYNLDVTVVVETVSLFNNKKLFKIIAYGGFVIYILKNRKYTEIAFCKRLDDLLGFKGD